MKTAFSFFFSFLIVVGVCAQDELVSYRDELSRALKIRNADSIATAYCHLGEYYAYRNSDSTRYFCQEGLKFAHRNPDGPYLYLLNNLADTYTASGDFEQASHLLRQTLAEGIDLRVDTSFQVAVLTSLGVVYRRREMPDSALYYYNRGFDLLKGRQAYDEETHLLTSIAVLYANTSRIEEAEQYARRAVEASTRCEDIDMVFYAGNTAGSIFSLNGKYEEAVKQIYPLLDVAKRQEKPRFVLKGITYLLGIFRRMNQTDSIDHYRAEAEKLIPLLSENSAEVQGYREILYQILADMGRYRESLAIQKQMMATDGLASQTPADRLYLYMARNYHALQEHAHAADCYEQAYHVADSLHKAAIETEMSEFSVKYQTYEKELEIARLNEMRSKQEVRILQWILVAFAALAALAVTLIGYLFHRRRMRKEEELKVAQSYIEGMERERTRLAKDLHDGICNDLLGVGMQVQALLSDGEARQEVLRLLERVRGDVRYISHELMPPKFRYVTLVEAVEGYVSQMLLPPSMRVTLLQKPDNADWGRLPDHVSYEVYRIVQELLSNIVRHSVASEVRIEFLLEAHRLSLKIADNDDTPLKQPMAGQGIGLVTVAERVKVLGGVLRQTSKDGWLQFMMEIPLH